MAGVVDECGLWKKSAVAYICRPGGSASHSRLRCASELHSRVASGRVLSRRWPSLLLCLCHISHPQYSFTQPCYLRLRGTPYGIFFSTLTHARNRPRLLPACPIWPSSLGQADAPEQGCSTRVEELLSHPYRHLDSPEHEGIAASRTDERRKEVALCGESVYSDS